MVAAMNPFDAVGTARISSAVYDRTCRIAMGYQSERDELAIVERHGAPVPESWRAKVVELARSTRDHDDVHIGSSVRGAIDMARIASSLAKARGVDVTDWHVGLDSALVSLSGRVRLVESCTRPPEAIVRELYETVFGPPPSADDPSADTGASGDVTGEHPARHERAAAS